MPQENSFSYLEMTFIPVGVLQDDFAKIARHLSSFGVSNYRAKNFERIITAQTAGTIRSFIRRLEQPIKRQMSSVMNQATSSLSRAKTNCSDSEGNFNL